MTGDGAGERKARGRPSGFPAAGHYVVHVSLSPRGYLTVWCVRRVWNGKDVFDRRMDLKTDQVAPSQLGDGSVREVLRLALELIMRR